MIGDRRWRRGKQRREANDGVRDRGGRLLVAQHRRAGAVVVLLIFNVVGVVASFGVDGGGGSGSRLFVFPLSCCHVELFVKTFRDKRVQIGIGFLSHGDRPSGDHLPPSTAV